MNVTWTDLLAVVTELKCYQYFGTVYLVLNKTNTADRNLHFLYTGLCCMVSSDVCLEAEASNDPA